MPVPVPEPVVPPVVEPEDGAVLDVAFAARALNSVKEREALAAVLWRSLLATSWSLSRYKMWQEATHFSLMTMTMPLWQCLPWAQYSQMGLESLIMTV